MSQRFIYSETPVKEVKTLFDQLDFGPEEKDEEGCLVRKLDHIAVSVREYSPLLDASFSPNFRSRLYLADYHSKEDIHTHSCPLGLELYQSILAALQNPVEYSLLPEEEELTPPPEEIVLEF